LIDSGIEKNTLKAVEKVKSIYQDYGDIGKNIIDSIGKITKEII